MFSRKLINISAIAVSLWVWAPAASSGSLSQLEGKAAYQPVQNISYEFGLEINERVFPACPQLV